MSGMKIFFSCYEYDGWSCCLVPNQSEGRVINTL